MSARRTANRRRRAGRDWRAIGLRVVRIGRNLAFVAAAVAITWLSLLALDRPVQQVSIDGPFHRVTAGQLEGVVRSYLPAGVLGVRLGEIQRALETLDWVDRVSIRRRWPDGLHLSVSEQIPAARWGEHGLLNVRGELFIESTRQVPAELPRLDGPAGSEWQVAQRYLGMRDRLLRAGLALSALTLDARGAWRAQLSNGIEVRLGRQDSDRRMELFVALVAPMIAAREVEVDYVDMRYSNGFVIGWQRGVGSRSAEVLADA